MLHPVPSIGSKVIKSGPMVVHCSVSMHGVTIGLIVLQWDLTQAASSKEKKG